MGFPGGLDDRESTCNTGDLGLIPGLGRPLGEENGQPTLISLPEESLWTEDLAGYSPWGRKESNTTERLSTAQWQEQPGEWGLL